MVENKKPEFDKKIIDFLSDDLFIYWRINPTQELTDYWENFLKYNPQLNTKLQQAIREFEDVRVGNATRLTEEQLQFQKKIEKSLYLHKKKQKKLIYYSTAVAAVVLLLIVFTVLFINKNYSAEHGEEILVLGNTISNNEIQLLSGGETVSLHNNSTLDLSVTNNSVIIEDSLSQKELKLKENTTNKLITPYGKRSSLILADGSKVWLNSGTEIEFPSVFSGNSREIKVNGEIYIEVVKQHKPFMVHTANSQIQVFGTAFNVSTYADDQKESIVLIEGSIQIQSNNTTLMLSPNQLAEIVDGTITSKVVNVTEYTSWKDGFMQLNKVPLDEVLRKIGRYYNVEFRYDGNINLSSKTCSGKLFLSDDITDILKSFTDMTILNYEKQSNNIINIKN